MKYQFYGREDLIWEPGQRVTNFPSGLIKIDRTAICRRDKLNRALRNQFEINSIMPTANNLDFRDRPRIYPEAQEEELSNGFVRFYVTAYTRERAFSFGSSRRQSFSELAFYEGERAVLPIIRLQYVVLTTERLRTNNPFGEETTYYTLDGGGRSFSQDRTELRALERDNYGFFDEVTEVWGVEIDRPLLAPEQIEQPE
jgi:hypothetical protein